MRTTTPLLLAAVVAAQDPIEQLDRQLLPTIEAKLASDDAKDVAWGGYLAHRYRLRPATRALCDALERWRGEEGLEARFVRLHLVDGLVGAGAQVPGEQVEPLLDDPLTRAAAFAVMARDVLVNREALERLALAPAEPGELVRAAAARLLVAHDARSPALAAHVLEHLRCELQVTVEDVASIVEEFGEAVDFGRFLVPEKVGRQPGFPPLVRLVLTTSANSEHTADLVVPARVGGGPVLLLRHEPDGYRPDELERRSFAPTFAEPELVNLLHRMSGVRVRTRVREVHQWRSAASFVRGYTDVRDRMRSRLDKAVAELRRRGWLEDGQLPGFRIELRERVLDERGDKSRPLPEIPAPPAAGR